MNAPARSPDAPSVETHPHQYIIEMCPDGRIAVQASHAGVTAPVAFFTNGDDAIAHVTHLLKNPPQPEAR